MELKEIRAVILEAVSGFIANIAVPGICGVRIDDVILPPERLERLAAGLEQTGYESIVLTTKVSLGVRISNDDELETSDSADITVTLSCRKNKIEAVATSDKDWVKAWESGIAPITNATLRTIKQDIWDWDATLPEDSYKFQCAMVLLASELFGPYVDRLVTALGYPRELVQVIAARLVEAKIWEGDTVHCERWFDSNKGGVSFMLDWMVAQGMLIRQWSDEKRQFTYDRRSEPEVSRLAV